ncbi:MAG: helix-turn-helix transcriptional regulator [Burkholderiales bacterium]|nr:helix-turn-helix transcriptional regulator [Burkholderiales bacterium]
MPVAILRHTLPRPEEMHPTPERPIRLVARDLLASQTLEPHSHPWGQVTYAPSGMLQVIAEGTVWFVPPLRAIWIPPQITHEVRVLETSQLRVLHIHASRSPFSGPDCLVLEVSALLRELVAGLGQLDQAGQREDHLAAVIMDELQAAQPLPIRLPMPHDKRLRSLCEMLLADPASSTTLEEFAQQVGASSRTLARLFEQDLGMRFGSWRQQMRLARATPLIASGLPLAQVAAELGYTSQSAFSAMFKKTLGKSPSAFFRQK